MAKYTDPNTGVKYSTHTGLKVFTVIVVILLVISIVLNVVLYTQNSDGELDSGESGELEDDYADGDYGEGDVEYGDGNKEADDGGDSFDDGSNDGNPSGEGDGSDESGDIDSSGNSGGLPPVDESIVDTVTVIENERVVLTSDFDEYGIASGLYFYPDGNILTDEGSYIGCGFCEGPCEGHEVWVSKGGAVYDCHSEYDPIVVPQVLYAEDGSTDINSEIRASIVFNTIHNVTYEEYYYSTYPNYIEIVSLTGDSLEIESAELKQYTYYERTDDIYHQTYIEYRSESGVSHDITPKSAGYESPDVTTVYPITNIDISYGEVTFILTLSDGSAYSFEYWFISDPDHMIGSEVVYIA